MLIIFSHRDVPFQSPTILHILHHLHREVRQSRVKSPYLQREVRCAVQFTLFLTLQTPEIGKHTQFEEDLESLPSLASGASNLSSYDPWKPYEIPEFPDKAEILEWKIVAKGGHGEFRRVRARRNREAIFGIKLFTEEWKDAYGRELDAYTLLLHRGVKRCIPEVYYKRVWPRWEWDGQQPDDYEYVDREEILCGIVMEYFEDFQEIDMKRADIHMAEKLLQILELMENVGVLHRDVAERNILLVREADKTRIVFVDFSCAWAGKVYQGPNPIERDMFRGFLVESMVILKCSEIHC